MAAEARTFLVRHATSVSNSNGVYSDDPLEPLSAGGQAEAARVAAAMQAVPLDAIISSPFRRALETAAPLADAKRIVPIEDNRLGELQLGPWAGLGDAEIRDRFSTEWRIWRESPNHLRLPGREDLHAMRVRASAAFDELAERKECVAVFTHDAVIRTLVAHVLGVPSSIYRAIPIANASISLVVSGGRHELTLLNSTSHLRGLA